MELRLEYIYIDQGITLIPPAVVAHHLIRKLPIRCTPVFMSTLYALLGSSLQIPGSNGTSFMLSQRLGMYCLHLKSVCETVEQHDSWCYIPPVLLDIIQLVQIPRNAGESGNIFTPSPYHGNDTATSVNQIVYTMNHITTFHAGPNFEAFT